MQVLLFLEKHHIPDDGMKTGRPTKTGQPRKNNSSHDTPGYRSPTFREASKFFKILVTTLQDWWSRWDKLVNKELSCQYLPYWPDLEAELYKVFQARRKEHKGVSVGWFRRESCALFKRLYPTQEKLFVFSSGWFTGFQKWYRISRRRVTKKATKLPEEYLSFVNKFL